MVSTARWILNSLRKTEGEGKGEGQARNAQFRPFFQTDLLFLQQFNDGGMIVEGYDIVASYLEPVGNVTEEFVGVDTIWSVSCAPGLALSFVPRSTHLGRDLPPAADVNSVFPTPGNLEAAA